MRKIIGGKDKRGQKGVTLVALVVTIVVLIILSTISISAVFSEEGLMKQSQKIKEMQSNVDEKDRKELNGLLEEYSTIRRDDILVEKPQIDEGAMIPVKWNDKKQKWMKTTIDDEGWYDYTKKEWANVVLKEATFLSDGTLDESKPYSQLVWIPRYAYKITSGWHSSTTGTIDVVFISTSNKNIEGADPGIRTYAEATEGIEAGGSMKNYVVHPAFEYAGSNLSGIWVGKYESSHTGCTQEESTGSSNTNTTDLTMMIKANVTSWRNININNIFQVCLNMNQEGNIYGLNIDDSIVDPHMMKNTEWGAVAYLSKSKYGKETEEIWLNNSSTYITGNAGSSVNASSASGVTNAYQTTNGVKASTTGNVYGIYDISGGAWEYTAAYINNGNEYLTSNAIDIVSESTPSKYRDVYNIGSADSNTNNYATASIKYGDAIYETSESSGENTYTSWYKDYSCFPSLNYPFFQRGGSYNGGTGSGTYFFGTYDGNISNDAGFRVVISIP